MRFYALTLCLIINTAFSAGATQLVRLKDDVLLTARFDWHLRNPGTTYFIFNPKITIPRHSWFHHRYPSLAAFKQNPAYWQKWRSSNNGVILFDLTSDGRFRTVAILPKGTRLRIDPRYGLLDVGQQMKVFDGQIDSGAYKGYKISAIDLF